MSNSTYVYDSGSNQYLEVRDIQFNGWYTSLEWSHKFFPGNHTDAFQINGRVLRFVVEQILSDWEDRILFVTQNSDNVPQLVATGIMKRVNFVLSEMES